MKLLFVTQKVDADDAVLGFVHGWLKEFAKHFESITVICLFEGTHSLPENVRVLSLGKERGTSRLTRVVRFLRYIIILRRDYESVLVHMNQEYILLAGWLWKLLRKRIYLWRNHYAGNFLTDIAAAFCTHVFCASKYSYTAKYAKTILMPVGIDTIFFRPAAGPARANTVLSLGRISPAKKLEVLVGALAQLPDVEADIYGTAERDGYLDSLRQTASRTTHFKGPVFTAKEPEPYQTHELFVNTSPSGMLDKTIFEAAACGSLILTSSKDLQKTLGEQFYFEEGNADALAQKMQSLLALPEEEKQKSREHLRTFVLKHHSLKMLGEKLSYILTS